MNIQLKTQYIELPTNTGEDLKQRLAGQFWRFADRIPQLRVTLKDINGPRGGRDKVCIMHASLADGGELVVSETSAKLGVAISRCARRMRRAARREMKRRLNRVRQRGRRLAGTGDVPA